MQNVIFTQKTGQEDEDFQERINFWMNKLEKEPGGDYSYFPHFATRGPLMTVIIFYEWKTEEGERHD